MAIYYNTNIVTSGLVLYLDAANSKSYPGTGTAWTDMINSKVFTATGTPSFSNGFFTFNGTTDYFSNTNLNLFALNTSTTIYITYPTYNVAGGQRVNISYRGGSGGQLYIGTQSGSIFSYYDSLSTPSYVNGAITANAWNVCAVVTDSTNSLIKHYVNGSLLGSITRTGFSNFTNSALRIGYDAGTNEYFQGRISLVKVYNRVLTDAEIQQNYNALRGRYGL